MQLKGRFFSPTVATPPTGHEPEIALLYEIVVGHPGDESLADRGHGSSVGRNHRPFAGSPKRALLQHCQHLGTFPEGRHGRLECETESPPGGDGAEGTGLHRAVAACSPPVAGLPPLQPHPA